MCVCVFVCNLYFSLKALLNQFLLYMYIPPGVHCRIQLLSVPGCQNQGETVSTFTGEGGLSIIKNIIIKGLSYFSALVSMRASFMMAARR